MFSTHYREARAGQRAFSARFLWVSREGGRNSSLDLLLPINQSATAAKNVTRVYEILVRHIHSRVRMEHQYSCWGVKGSLSVYMYGLSQIKLQIWENNTTTTNVCTHGRTPLNTFFWSVMFNCRSMYTGCSWGVKSNFWKFFSRSMASETS